MCSTRTWGIECRWGQLAAGTALAGSRSTATEGLRIASDRGVRCHGREFRQAPDWSLTSAWRPEKSLACLMH
jgi:hypothetical protein